MPALATAAFGAVLAALASPGVVGGLVFSAVCFALLVRRWRGGAGRGG